MVSRLDRVTGGTVGLLHKKLCPSVLLSQQSLRGFTARVAGMLELGRTGS